LRGTVKRIEAIFAILLVLFTSTLSASAETLLTASSAGTSDTASIFVGESLFFDFEKKLSISDALDYFFTDEKISYASFEEKYLPCILELLEGGSEAFYRVWFSFGEQDTENPFAFQDGVGAEIAALINELSALYKNASFSFCTLMPEKEENRAGVEQLNEAVRTMSVAETWDLSVSDETGLTDITSIRSSGKAVLTAFEKLKNHCGAGDTGLLFADAVGYLYEAGSFLADFSGLRAVGDTVYYFESGVFRPEYEGIASMDGEEYYVRNGVIDRSQNTTITQGGTIITIENGKVTSREETDRSYTPEELHAMKAVFLTFDDGPSPVTTELLDIMDRYGVKATFFVTKQPVFVDILKDAASRGHEIAVHTSSHDYETIYASYDAWKADFDDIYSWIIENTGVAPTCYRFPGGSNTKRPTAEDKQKMKDYVHSLGMEYYDWNVITGDGDWRVTAAEELVNATSEIDLRTLPVILAHDQDHNKSTAEALDSILKELTGRGYRFMTLRPGIPPVQQGANWDY